MGQELERKADLLRKLYIVSVKNNSQILRHLVC